MVFLPERGLAFNKLGIDRYAGYRANLHALRLVKVAHAFGAFVGINFIDFRAEKNRLVRAFGLAHIAIDAFVSNQERHGQVPFDSVFKAASTFGLTIWLTSPPSLLISRTSVLLMHCSGASGSKNTVSTFGCSLRFMAAIWAS